MDLVSQVSNCDVEDLPLYTKKSIDTIITSDSLLSDSIFKSFFHLLINDNSAVACRAADIIFSVLKHFSSDTSLIDSIISNFNFFSTIKQSISQADILSRLALTDMFGSFIDDPKIASTFSNYPPFSDLVSFIFDDCNSDEFIFDSCVHFSSCLGYFQADLVKKCMSLLRAAVNKQGETRLIALKSIGKLLCRPISRQVFLEEKPASSSLAVTLVSSALTPPTKLVSSPESLVSKHGIAEALVTESQQNTSGISVLLAFEHASRRLNVAYPVIAFQQVTRSAGDVDANVAALHLIQGLCSVPAGLQAMTRVAGFNEFLNSRERIVSNDIALKKYDVVCTVVGTEERLRKDGKGLLSDKRLIDLKVIVTLGPYHAVSEFAVKVGELVGE
ncbi:hypothetical protein RCL1_003157 [Eukaryota sp. TZLM3-RCL]